MKHNENTKYVKLGITGAAVLAFGFATAYILNQSANIAAGIQVVFNILKPFLYGALIAYILAPMCNRMDERFLKWFPNATEKKKISVYCNCGYSCCNGCGIVDHSDPSAGMGQYSEAYPYPSGTSFLCEPYDRSTIERSAGIAELF